MQGPHNPAPPPGGLATPSRTQSVESLPSSTDVSQGFIPPPGTVMAYPPYAFAPSTSLPMGSPGQNPLPYLYNPMVSPSLSQSLPSTSLPTQGASSSSSSSSSTSARLPQTPQSHTSVSGYPHVYPTPFPPGQGYALPPHAFVPYGYPMYYPQYDTSAPTTQGGTSQGATGLPGPASGNLPNGGSTDYETLYHQEAAKVRELQRQVQMLMLQSHGSSPPPTPMKGGDTIVGSNIANPLFQSSNAPTSSPSHPLSYQYSGQSGLNHQSHERTNEVHTMPARRAIPSNTNNNHTSSGNRSIGTTTTTTTTTSTPTSSDFSDTRKPSQPRRNALTLLGAIVTIQRRYRILIARRRQAMQAHIEHTRNKAMRETEAAVAKYDALIRQLETNQVGSITPQQQSIMDQLAKVSLLSAAGFSRVEMATLAAALVVKRFPPRTAIVRQGDPGKMFYIIISGNVTVYQSKQISQAGSGQSGSRSYNGVESEGMVETKELAKLGAGDYFGETALLTNAPRNATVVATTEVVCYTLVRRLFVLLFGKERLRQRLTTRLTINSNETVTDTRKVTPKSSGQRFFSEGHSHESKSSDANSTNSTNGEMSTSSSRSRSGDGGKLVSHKEEDEEGDGASSNDETIDIQLARELGLLEPGMFNPRSNTALFDDDDDVANMASTTSSSSSSSSSTAATRSHIGSLHGGMSITGGDDDVDISSSDAPGYSIDLTGRNTIKSPTELNMLLESVQASILFRQMERVDCLKAIKKMFSVVVPQGKTVVRRGDPGISFFIVSSGDLVISTSPTEGDVRHIPIKRGASFGELALMYNSPRTATVTAQTDSTLWVLPRVVFRDVVSGAGQRVMHQVESFLSKVPLLSSLTKAERSLLADALESIHYPSGRAIVREGTPGRTFFIIRSGKVRVTKGITNPDGTQSEELLTVLGQGDYFGERALLANIPRAATCTADGPVDCYYVHSVHFNLLLGHLKPTLLKLAGMDTDMTVTIGNTNDPIHLNNHPNTLRRGSLVDIPPMSRGETLLSTEVKGPTSASSSSPSSSSPSSSSSNEPLIPYNGLASTRLGRDPVAWRASLPPHLKGRGIQLDNFTIISEIARPRCGIDYLVVDKHGKPFCLRKLSKSRLIDAGAQHFHSLSRGTRLELLQVHPFISKVYGGFQDQDAVYLIRDACQGGSVASLLQSRTIFDDHTARFIAAGIILAFEHLHAQGVAFRDLKPENVLITSSGYPRLTGFSCAKLIRDGRTFTVCGTPDYLAPEVLSGRGHTTAVDWWTLGIMIYEMLVGFPPFFDVNPMKSCAAVLSGSITWPTQVGPSARSVISQLLHVKPTKRLGMHRDSGLLFRHEPWFSESTIQSLTSPPSLNRSVLGSSLLGTTGDETSPYQRRSSITTVDPQIYAAQPFDFKLFELLSMASPVEPSLSGPLDTSCFTQTITQENGSNEHVCPSHTPINDEPPWDTLF